MNDEPNLYSGISLFVVHRSLFIVFLQESLGFLRLGFLFFFLSAFDLKSGFFENEFVITGVSLELQLELFGLLAIRSFFETDLSVGHNDDGRFSEDRTALLAKPAAVALRGDDDRAAIPLDRTKNYRIVRKDLITSQAALVLR